MPPTPPVKLNTSGSLDIGDTTDGDSGYGYQDDTLHVIPTYETAGVKSAAELKIIRLALRRMVVTQKKKPKPIVPLFKKPKMRLGVTHRKPK